MCTTISVVTVNTSASWGSAVRLPMHKTRESNSSWSLRNEALLSFQHIIIPLVRRVYIQYVVASANIPPTSQRTLISLMAACAALMRPRDWMCVRARFSNECVNNELGFSVFQAVKCPPGRFNAQMITHWRDGQAEAG